MLYSDERNVSRIQHQEGSLLVQRPIYDAELVVTPG